MAESPLAKRPRTEANGSVRNDDNILDPIAPHVLERAIDWAAVYQNATPYSHGIIPDFCSKGFLGQ